MGKTVEWVGTRLNPRLTFPCQARTDRENRRDQGGTGREAGLYEEDGFAPVPRLQIVSIEEALQLRDRAVRLPARRDDAFKKTAREEDTKAQGKLDI